MKKEQRRFILRFNVSGERFIRPAKMDILLRVEFSFMEMKTYSNVFMTCPKSRTVQPSWEDGWR